MKKYDDIINLPHHVSKTHPQMSMRDRAAQFSPFAAFTGYEDAIDETGRLTAARRELSELEQTDLNAKLVFLAAHLKEEPEVSIEYFVPDERKAGGSYQAIVGAVRRISLPEHLMIMSSEETIRINDIVGITGAVFEEMQKE